MAVAAVSISEISEKITTIVPEAISGKLELNSMLPLFANRSLRLRISELMRIVHSNNRIASLCGSVGKDFVYHAFGHDFKSRLN